MKKFLTMFMALAFLAFFASCTGRYEQTTDPPNTDTPSIVCDCVPTVEGAVACDMEFMFNNYGDKYSYLETSVTLNAYLDADDCDGSIATVTNIFQVAEEYGTGYDTKVLICSHSYDTALMEVIHGFWVGDNALDSTVLTFDEAYERLCEANYKKPHSRQCVLRKQVGPVACNAQYIFGNTANQIYVDAVTGEVSDKNPAFRGVRTA